MDTCMDTILVVDDTAFNIEVLTGILAPHYRVLTAGSGPEALALCRSDRPSLVLLDVLMPGMDGYEVCRRLKGDPRTRDVPVIFLTALSDSHNEERGLALGAVDYLPRPCPPAIVLLRVRIHLELKQARDRLRDHNAWLEAEVAERTCALEASQRQLLQSERMAAMGVLAAGVAHELSTPIAFVHANLDGLAGYAGDCLGLLDRTAALLEGYPDGGPARAYRALAEGAGLAELRADLPRLVAETREGLERMRRIVTDIKGFARGGDDAWAWCDLNALCDGALNLVRNELKHKCQVTRDYGDLPPVHCIPGQIGQVLVNLLVNAAQAIDRQGRITLTTRAAPGRVTLEVRDDGRGIAPGHLGRVFDPFFTTKPVGQGTGLGLSISTGICARHRGTLQVESTLGQGTAMRMELPIDPAGGDDPAGD